VQDGVADSTAKQFAHRLEMTPKPTNSPWRAPLPSSAA